MFATIFAATPRSGSAAPPAGTTGGGAVGRGGAAGEDTTGADDTAGGEETTGGEDTTAVTEADVPGEAATEAGAAGFEVMAEPFDPFAPLPGDETEARVSASVTARTGPVGEPLPVEK